MADEIAEAAAAMRDVIDHAQVVIGLKDRLTRAARRLEVAGQDAGADERERIASAIPADTIDGLADYLIRVGARFEGPVAVPDLPARLKRLAGLLREPPEASDD